MTNETTFADALHTFLVAAQTLVDGFYKDGEAKLETMVGRRYVRVVRVLYGNQHSVHCFVDRTNGDVLKPAGWKAPAKGRRGNIYTDDYGVGPLGAKNFRRW